MAAVFLPLQAQGALPLGLDSDGETDLRQPVAGIAGGLRRWPWRSAVAAMAAAVALLGAGFALAAYGDKATVWLRGSLGQRSRVTTGAAASGVVGLQEMWGDTSSTAAAEAVFMPPSAPHEVDRYFNMMMNDASGEGAGDGNGCNDNEELHQGLCYKRCSLLTNGTFGLRTSAWTCCSAKELQSCFIKNQIKNLGLCSGYDVSGDGKSCPRAPGRCDNDKELYYGTCFPKCSLLTNGTKPFRHSPFTCCDSASLMNCFTPSAFGVQYVQGAEPPKGTLLDQMSTTETPPAFR